MNERSPLRIGLFIREAWRNIRAAPGLMFVAILTIAVSLVLVGLFGFVVLNGHKVLDTVGHDLQMTVYLEPTISVAEVDAIVVGLEAREEVDTITVLSPEEDRDRNLELLTPELLEGLDNAVIPFQPAIDIALKPRQRSREDFEILGRWVEELSGVEGVQELHFGADKIRVLFALMDLIQLTGLFICSVVLIAAVFFTLSVIKLAVMARKDEIEVLRLVGATDGFIRAPFYIEGAAAGLCGSVIALLVVTLLHTRLVTFIEEEHFMNIPLDLLPGWMILWLLAGGTLLGLLGSALSVRRHLR